LNTRQSTRTRTQPEPPTPESTKAGAVPGYQITRWARRCQTRTQHSSAWLAHTAADAASCQSRLQSRVWHWG
jgi:hypothetical protein